MSSTTDIELYRDTAGDWRWRLRDPSNNLIIAASTEGYANREDAMKNVVRIQWLFGLEVRFTEPKQG
jgi:uncharacterized protein YegP (UPF0339 family)